MNRAALAQAATARDDSRRGFAFGVAAYGLWGVLPIYFKAIADVPAVDIVAHRVLWSLPFLALLLFVGKDWAKVGRALRNRRTLGLLAVTAILIGVNWLLYVYTVTTGHILAASLGYYLNPLANVLLGRFVLKERLSWLQWTAVAVAGAGIAVLAGGALGQLWISLTLCVSFALYGLFRKIVSVDALAGLAVETGLLFPIALGWLVWQAVTGASILGTSSDDATLLAFAGIVSTTPLLLFTGAARRIPYSTLGMLQFLAPTLQFLCAIWLYGEEFTRAHAIAFASIWIALVLYVIALIRAPRLPAPPE